MMRNRIVRYWGRKPLELARRYINRYSRPNDLVLDSFGGSGIFVKSALELQRRAIYVDLNPFAELIAHSSIEGCDINSLKVAVEKILSRKELQVRLRRKLITIDRDELFSVKCPCGRDVEVRSISFSRRYRINTRPKIENRGLKKEVLDIIKRHETIMHDDLVRISGCLYSKKNLKAVKSRENLSKAVKSLVRENIIEEEEVPVSATLEGPCVCGRLRVDFKNQLVWTVDSPIKPYYWYPKDSLSYDNGRPFLKKRDVSRVNEFFIDRSLALLSAIWHDIRCLKLDERVERCLELIFMATLARSSKMCRDGNGTWPVNSYWIPRNFAVKNPYKVFGNAATQVIRLLMDETRVVCGKANDVISGEANIAFIVASSTKFTLPKSVVDYAIIDPPHTDEAQFLELSVFYTSWLRKKLNFKDELVINSHQGKTLERYLEMLERASERIHCALKDGGYFTTILHEEDSKILKQSRDVIEGAGFKLIKEDDIGDYSIFTFEKFVASAITFC